MRISRLCVSYGRSACLFYLHEDNADVLSKKKFGTDVSWEGGSYGQSFGNDAGGGAQSRAA
jgi:hypothetical protein